MAVWIGSGLVLLALLAVVISYNRFVSQRHLIANAWSNVDTELRRRYDLVPNLVETVKGYAAHEREVLEAVVTARSRALASHGDPSEQARDENVLVDALRQLLALREAYPDLEANEQFEELQRQLVVTEDRIQAARRFFNANVRDYNRRVESVPSNVVAALGGFRREPYFEVEATLREAGAPGAGLRDS